MIWSSLKQWVAHEIARLVQLDTLSTTSPDGESDRADGHSQAPEDPVIPSPIKRRPSFGFAFRPPAGAEVLTIRASGLRVYLAAYVKGLAPALDEGEVAVYDASGSVLRLFKDGSVKLTAESGGSAEITAAGDVIVMPKNGRAVFLATEPGALAADPVVTRSELNLKLSAIAAHTHPETGTTTQASAALSGLSANGSSAVRAKYP